LGFVDADKIPHEIVQAEEDLLHEFDRCGPQGLVLGADKDLLQVLPLGHQGAACDGVGL
jgi:hypothetical protein